MPDKNCKKSSKATTNSDMVKHATRWFGKTISTASASCFVKERKWRQKHLEVGQEKPGASKQTRILETEKLNALIAQRCQQIERANGRLSKFLIK